MAKQHGSTKNKASAKYWIEIQYFNSTKKTTRYIAYSNCSWEFVSEEAAALASNPQVKCVETLDRLPESLRAIAP